MGPNFAPDTLQVGDVLRMAPRDTVETVATIAPPEQSTSPLAQPDPRRRLFGPAVLVLAVLVVVGTGVGAGLAVTSQGSAPGPPPNSVGTTENRTIPASVLDAPLVDQNGRATSLEAFRGKIVVLASFLTSCQETCPITTGAFLLMQRAVDAAGDSW